MMGARKKDSNYTKKNSANTTVEELIDNIRDKIQRTLEKKSQGNVRHKR